MVRKLGRAKEGPWWGVNLQVNRGKASSVVMCSENERAKSKLSPPILLDCTPTSYSTA